LSNIDPTSSTTERGHPRYRGWVLIALGALAFCVAAIVLVQIARLKAPIRVTIAHDHSRLKHPAALQRLANLARRNGLELQLLETQSSRAVLESVDSGKLDFALIPGGFDFSGYRNLRQVTGLHVEPLHLLVKAELADNASSHLNALRGKRVQLGGGPETGSYWLAHEVLAFVGLSDKAGDYVVSTRPLAQVLKEEDRAQRPDAIFVVDTLPSNWVRSLVADKHYRLVGLPFRAAFALGAMSEITPPDGGATPHEFVLLKEHILDTIIPAFTYGADPGVPPEPVHTLGMTVLLVTNAHTSREAVMRMLDTIYNTRFAKLSTPPLDARLLEQIPELPWHPGSIDYRELAKPVFTGESLSTLGNWFTIGGPIVGFVACVWQWFRQRKGARREESFELFLVKVSEIEREAMDLDLSGKCDLASITRLQHALGRLKAEALEKFHNDELQGEALMTSFLTHVNGTRDYLLSLLLTQRARVEEQSRAVPSGSEDSSNEPGGPDAPAPPRELMSDHIS
jgi:TRAP-type uncharacterized transport system substrate-binding protein